MLAVTKGTTVTGHIVAGLDGNPKDMYYVRLLQNICILCRIVRELDGIDLGECISTALLRAVDWVLSARR